MQARYTCDKLARLSNHDHNDDIEIAIYAQHDSFGTGIYDNIQSSTRDVIQC